MEVDTRATILRAQRIKKRIFAPVITENFLLNFREVSAICDVQRNSDGVMEPNSGEFLSPAELDIELTPGAAFADSGNRIGLGKANLTERFHCLQTETFASDRSSLTWRLNVKRLKRLLQTLGIYGVFARLQNLTKLLPTLLSARKRLQKRFFRAQFCCRPGLERSAQGEHFVYVYR